MKQMLFVLALATGIVACQKAEFSQEFIQKDFFYRIAAYDDGGSLVDYSYIVTTKVAVGAITGELRGEAYTDDEPPHHDGDGCNENDAKFCKKHPWHKKCQTLGLKMTEFAVQKNKDHVLVFWKLENEGSIVKFDVERSEDGKTWISRASVKANGSDLFYTYKDYGK